MTDNTEKAPEILRKIRAKDVMQEKIKAPGENDGTVMLFTILGRANNVRYGEQGFGAFYAFKGEFEAIRSSDGQRFIATECFLPEPMHSHIVNQYLAAMEANEQPPLIEFAFNIGVRAASVPIGYEYVTTPIVQPKATDTLADLRAKALAPPADVTDIKEKKKA